MGSWRFESSLNTGTGLDNAGRIHYVTIRFGRAERVWGGDGRGWAGQGKGACLA